jgi:eukaryotic-like serine/threonine-protein kinase
MNLGGKPLTRLGGRFVLVREIGAGGVSTVFLGRDEILDRPVAVKILKPDLEGSDVGARFRREGRTAARLSHPNIIQVYDAGEAELDGRPVSYMVVEYMPGGDIGTLVRGRGPLPGPMLSRIGADVAAGLAHAHERGVIHRDIKPHNILLDEYGNPKLTDFGVARALDATGSTLTGPYLGTALYSSPEQLQEQAVTPKSDVYSLGATLYHAAVGEPPFSGGLIEVATRQVARDPVPPRSRGASIGQRLEDLILDCLAKDPTDRPDAATLQERLLQMSAAATGALSGVTGVTRTTGAVKTAGAASVRAVRQRLGRRKIPAFDGPPEATISVPTRTFQAGARQRMRLAASVAALLALGLIAAGSWALLGTGSGGETASQPFRRVAEPLRRTPEAPAAPSAENAAAVEPPAREETDSGPVPPAAKAERAVFDMYVQESYQRAEASWAYLSERMQQEMGSPAQWARQEEISDLYWVQFTRYPAASVEGDTAEVAFEVRLDRYGGSELLSGTWVCVPEGGAWKLDRMVNEKTVSL